MLEFAYCKITRVSGTHSLFSKETDAEVSLEDHRYVVGAVTNRERDGLRVIVLNKLDHLSLLLWANPAAYYGLETLCDFEEVPL